MNPLLTTDQFMEALALYREGRGESLAAKSGMLAVIRNRAAQSPKFGWPKTTIGVITQSRQFSSFNPEDPNAMVWPDASKPGSWQAWMDCCNVVQAQFSDPTQGANHYEALPPGAPRPEWASPNNFTVTIGKTRFYRL